MALQKLKTHRRKIGPQQWWVQVVYRCNQSEAESQEAFLWDTTPSGFSGRSAPICKDVKVDYEYYTPAKSRIIAVYRTPSWDDYCLLNPNKFVLRARASVTGESVKEDLDGNTIEGTDPDDADGLTKWKVEKGQNHIFRPKVAYIVRGIIYDRWQWFDQWTEDLGKVNSSNMSKFGKHQQPGELLFTGMRMVPHVAEDDRWWITYLFMGNEDGWNSDCISRKYSVEVHQVQLKDTDDTLIEGEYRDVRVDAPETDTRTARLFDEANFSAINANVLW
jgi:hypothetical protein